MLGILPDFRYEIYVETASPFLRPSRDRRLDNSVFSGVKAQRSTSREGTYFTNSSESSGREGEVWKTKQNKIPSFMTFYWLLALISSRHSASHWHKVLTHSATLLSIKVLCSSKIPDSLFDSQVIASIRIIIITRNVIFGKKKTR